ncbi:hypothetical protein KSP39_PZI022170 [Platanthera zijinensis]|uniref:Ribosomal protein S21 n=1 Tax=Platanthera zijinensis TaxID=2320716 RepID=A0AAP0AVN0_9ASPA
MPAPSSSLRPPCALAMAASCSGFGLPLTIQPSFPSSACSRPFVLPNLPRRYLTTFSTALSLRPVVYSAFDPVEAIVNPSLSQANVLFFTSGYNVQIVVEENESEEMLIRRFRREVSKAGIIPECKRRMFFENIQEEKKRKLREAGRRNRRR